MILEEESFEAFGYYPSNLTQGSHKLIIVACELCGKFRITRKADYCTFCLSCVQKGKHFTEETKVLLTKNHATVKGKKHPMFGKHHTEETKAKIGATKKGEKHPNYGKRGEDSSNFKGGKKAADARHGAKRKRDLGYTLIAPVKEGEVGHHVTNASVIGILKEVHVHFGGKRQKHRTLILNWLKVHDKKKHLKVLCVLAKEPSKRELDKNIKSKIHI